MGRRPGRRQLQLSQVAHEDEGDEPSEVLKEIHDDHRNRHAEERGAGAGAGDREGA